MEKKDVIVNATHMCVLRKNENENRVKVDFVELKFKYQDQLDELERMVNNDNRTVLDMQDFVEGSKLRRLTFDFDFCSCLWDAYQGLSSLPSISYEDYQMKMDEYEKKGETAQRDTYAKKMRENYFNNIKRRVLPAMIEDLSNELHADPSILAFSHRRVGWASPAFNLNNDLQVLYLTNFGYGSASYFFLQIYYKGIGILPYSHWVHYRRASASEIIRYTRRYHLDNQEWKKTMAFTADIYNAAVSEPSTFVEKNILNEVEEMVSGLEAIRHSDKYCVQESFFNPDSLIITGDNLIRFKGEKISGALDFLDQLQTLAPITDKVATYIQRIMNCNLSIIDELQNAIIYKKKILKPILENINKEQPKWEELSAKNNEYAKMREELYNAISEEDEFYGKSWNIIGAERDTRFAKSHPEYDAFKEEYNTEHDLYYALCTKRDKEQAFIDDVQSYHDKIEKHKDYMKENNIAA